MCKEAMAKLQGREQEPGHFPWALGATPALLSLLLLLLTWLLAGFGLSTLMMGCVTGRQGQQRVMASESRKKADYHYQMGHGFLEGKQLPEAIQELQKAIGHHPDHVEALFLLGFIHMGRHEHDTALRYLQRAVEADPDFLEAKNNLGVAYLTLQRWEEAVEVYLELVANPVYGTPFMAHNNLGWAYLQQGRLNEAEEQFRKAVFFNPQLCVGFNNLGLTLLQKGEVREAKNYLMRATSADASCKDSYAEPHLHLGRYHEMVGDLRKAREHYHRCREMTQEFDSLRRRCDERRRGLEMVEQ